MDRRLLAFLVGATALVAVLWAFAWTWSRPDAAPNAASAPVPQAKGGARTPLRSGEELAAEEPPASRTTLGDGAKDPTCVLAVLGPDGGPLAGAWVAAIQGGAVLASGTTDDSGELALADLGEGVVAVLVQGPAAAPQVRELHPRPGRVEVRIEAGARLAGRVVVDGRPPAGPLALRLQCDRAIVDLERLLGIRWADVPFPTRGGTLVRGATGREGSFRFDGLPADWSGSLDLPDGYALTDRTRAVSRFFPNRLALRAPAAELMVEATRVPLLTGRVVDVPGGEPVPAVTVQSFLDYGDEDAAPGLASARTDAEGLFALALGGRSIRGGSLTLTARDALREIAVDPRELAGDWDVGDVALHPDAGDLDLVLVVQDRDGRPILGAVASTLDGSLRPSAPTDADGRTLFRGLRAGETVFRVAAVGFEPAGVRAPAEPVDEQAVVLRSATLLSIRFASPTGEGVPGMHAVLHASEHPLEHAEEPGATRALMNAGASSCLTRTIDGTVSVRVAPKPGEDYVVISGVKPGLPMTVKIADRFDAVAATKDLGPLAPEEHREVEIVLPKTPGSLWGYVLDERSDPLAGAAVSARSDVPGERGMSEARSISTSTDEAGRFAFASYCAERADLSVRKPGYVSARLPDVAVPPDGSPLEIRLPRSSNAVQVIVQDESGRRWDAESVSVRLSSGTTLFQREQLRTGVYLLRDLPSDEVLITVTVFQSTYERRHDPAVPELRVTIPPTGEVRVSVRMPEGLDERENCCVWLLPGDDVRPSRWARIDPGSTAPTPVLFSGVLPGRYEAVARRYVSGEGAESIWEDVTRRTPVVVGIAQTAEIEIAP